MTAAPSTLTLPTSMPKVPALEWEETLNKRRAMFRAVTLAEQSV